VRFESNSVHQGGCQHVVTENLIPFREIKVGIDNDASTLTPFRDVNAGLFLTESPVKN